MDKNGNIMFRMVLMFYANMLTCFFNTIHFTLFTTYGPHTKPHGVRELSNKYHMWFDRKLGHGTFEICQIPCACVGFMSMLDKPWVNSYPPQQQPHY